MFRGLSISFFVIAIHHLMLPDSRDFLKAGAIILVGIYFMLLYQNMKPLPKQIECLSQRGVLFSSIYSTFVLVAFAVLILSIYRMLFIGSYSLGLTLWSGVVLVLFSVFYIFLCKKIEKKKNDL